MNIRRAKEKDIPMLLKLLNQVLEIHASIRPDIFISGTTKYSDEALVQMIQDDQKPIYVAVTEQDEAIGYAMCQIKETPADNTNKVAFKEIYIDDLCVDGSARGQHVGEQLFEFVKKKAIELGCYEITLNVWAGNENAEKFYEKIGMKTQSRHMEYIL